MQPLRIVFMGTAEIACPSLAAVATRPGLSVVAVVTQPDRPRGRDLKVQASAVKQLAVAKDLPVLQPERARRTEFVQQLAGLRPDLIAVMAYGQILPPDILDLPRFGCVNVHTSLLPKYRGAAPIQWAILNDETETGVTIMKMDAGLDTGDILTQQATPIRPEDNAETLHDRLAQLGAELLVRTILDYVGGKIQPRPQSAELATHARKIRKEDGLIDWRLPARAIWNRVRAFTPWPGAYTFLPSQPQPQRLKFWRAEVVPQNGAPGEILSVGKSGIIAGCGQDALRVTTLQREGGRKLSAQEFLAGHMLKPGQKFITVL